MDPDSVAAVLETVAYAQTADELDEVVAAYPALLDDEAILALTAAGPPEGHGPADAFLDVVARRLRTCRDRGSDAAVAEVPPLIDGLPGAIPDPLRRAYVDFYAYQRGDDPDRLDRAAEGWQLGMKDPKWPTTGRRVQRMVLGDWGAVLLARYARSGAADDLDAAIRMYEKILHEGGSDDPEVRARWSGGLSNALQDRYRRDGAHADASQAVELAETAASSAADADAPKMLYTLARALRMRAEVEPGDADRAVEAGRAAVRAAGDDPQGYRYVNGLGLSLLQRYERTGALVDLDESLALLTDAYEAGRPGVPWYASLCNNLGLALLTRYERTRSAAYLDRAIEALRAGVDTAEDQADRAAHLSNLAGALHARYQLGGAIPDLLAASEAAWSAVETGSGPERADYLLNQAAIMLSLDELVPGQSTSVDEAVTALEEAVDAIDRTSPRWPAALKTLGDAYLRRLEETGDPEAAAMTLLAYRDASEAGLDVRPEAALLAGRAWCRWALRREAWDEAIIAGRRGMDAARLLHRRQLLREHSASFLRDVGDLPAQLAMAYAMTNAAPEALLVLESSRALLISEALEQARADLAGLGAEGHGELLDRYRVLSERLAALQALPAAGRPGVATAPAPDVVRELRGSLDAVVEEVRQVPGFDGFLGEPDLGDVFGIPNVPLVYLFTTPIGGAAYAVVGGARRSVYAFGLPDLSEEAVRGWLARYFDAYDARDTDPYAWEQTLDAVTGELWDAGMGRIVDALSEVDRAVLIPVGPIGLLPLHAAWTGTPRRYALDEVAFTYAPNARVMKAARDRADAAGSDRLLLVGVPGTGTRVLSDVDEEIAVVSGHFASVGRADDRAGVLAALPGSTFLHVAAHGRADLADPLDSALELSGGESLTLRDVFGVRLTGLRLAVLSACETAVVATDTPNEMVGLPAGLLQAGVAGVVATLWAVPDRTARVLTTLFYRAWRTDEREPPEALRIAQRRLREATNDELCAEIPSLVDRRPASEAAARFWGRARPFAAVRHWAAFTYVGA